MKHSGLKTRYKLYAKLNSNAQKQKKGRKPIGLVSFRKHVNN